MDAYDQDFFVIGPVKDPEAPTLREARGFTPEEGVPDLRRARMLKVEHLNALRVYSRHNVTNHAILAGRIHRLENHQQRLAVGGVQHLLQFAELRNVLGQ